MNSTQEAEVLRILEGSIDMSLATLRDDGYPQATTVGFVHDGTTIYFGCDRDAQKARNIAKRDKVSATVNLPYSGWEDIRGLSFGGRARVVEDPAELAKVGQLMLDRFPQVAEFTTEEDRQDAFFIAVEPEVISLLDYRKGFGHTEEFEVS